MKHPSSTRASKIGAAEDDEPFYGCLKGLATIRGDITKPVDIEWKALK